MARWLPEERSEFPRAGASMWAWVLLMIVAAALCLAHVTDLSVWEDEAWTLHVARQPNLATIMDFVREDSFPPLYFFLLHGWQLLAGDTLVVSRMVNVWAVLLGTALTFRLTLDMANLRAAFAATIVLITSDIVLAFVPFVRQYGFFLMLAALASYVPLVLALDRGVYPGGRCAALYHLLGRVCADSTRATCADLSPQAPAKVGARILRYHTALFALLTLVCRPGDRQLVWSRPDRRLRT
jgi:hypothetical protein